VKETGMATRIEIAQTGGPEVLSPVEFAPLAPAAGEVRLRHTAIGVNFIDTYHRAGIYPLPLPSGIGLEAAGVVEAVGDGVSNVAAGDRVGYFLGPIGAYATHRTLPAARLVKLPDSLSDEQAAAALLKAATVEFLVERCANVQAGDTVLVQAAAGGVGLLLVQWLKAVGANVIGTAGTAEKMAVAAAHGADHMLGYDELPARVREITHGRGVDVVIDGVGKSTFLASLDSLKTRGLHISFGNASGKIGEVDFGILAAKGSLYTTRPTLFDYYASDADFAAGTERVLDMLARGLKVEIGQRYPLADVKRLHHDLEARATTGSTIILP
jgi:NADPH2:quinone reductase